jgi:carbon storage regulator
MLVVTRKRGQKIQLGGETNVTVLAVEGRLVRIGIDVPAQVLVLRNELIDPRAAGIGASWDGRRRHYASGRA